MKKYKSIYEAKISTDKVKKIIKNKSISEIIQYEWDKEALGFSSIDDIIKLKNK